jgi:hypothetical protein
MRRPESRKLLFYKTNVQLCNAMGNYLGAQGRNRTTDTMIFSHVLYQLSYLGAGPGGGPPGQSECGRL